MGTKRPSNGHGGLLLPDALGVREGDGYEPLSSVWERSDGELLEAMFAFYATIPPDRSWMPRIMPVDFGEDQHARWCLWTLTRSTSR